MELKWQTYEVWEAEGLARGYDKRNPGSLRKSKSLEERRWYIRGKNMLGEKWIANFPFDREKEYSNLKNYHEWEAEGLQRGYDKRNPQSLKKSEDKEERKWYQRGSTMAPENWVEKFPFDRKREKFPWGTYEVWEAEGLQRGYDKRNPTSLMKSEDKEERKWYTRGAMMNPEYHWLSLFPFARRKAIKNSISLLESLLEEGGK